MSNGGASGIAKPQQRLLPAQTGQQRGFGQPMMGARTAGQMQPGIGRITGNDKQVNPSLFSDPQLGRMRSPTSMKQPTGGGFPIDRRQGQPPMPQQPPQQSNNYQANVDFMNQMAQKNAQVGSDGSSVAPSFSYNPETGQYMRDSSAFGLTGDAANTYYSPEEFQSEFGRTLGKMPGNQASPAVQPQIDPSLFSDPGLGQSRGRSGFPGIPGRDIFKNTTTGSADDLSNSYYHNTGIAGSGGYKPQATGGFTGIQDLGRGGFGPTGRRGGFPPSPYEGSKSPTDEDLKNTYIPNPSSKPGFGGGVFGYPDKQPSTETGSPRIETGIPAGDVPAYTPGTGVVGGPTSTTGTEPTNTGGTEQTATGQQRPNINTAAADAIYDSLEGARREMGFTPDAITPDQASFNRNFSQGYQARGADTRGYDAFSNNAQGYTAAGTEGTGYTASGTQGTGYTASGADQRGYTAAGTDSEGYNAERTGSQGFTGAQANAEGYRADNTGSTGYNATNTGSDGYAARLTGAQGFNAAGVGSTGYGAERAGSRGYSAQNASSQGYDATDASSTGYTARDNATGVGYSAERAGPSREVSAGSVQSGLLADTDLSSYMNQYDDAVVDNTLSDLNRARVIQQQNIGANATAAGAFGGSRHALREAENNRNFYDQAAKTAASLRQTGFTNAQQMGLSDIQNTMQGSLANQGANLQADSLSANLAQQTALANLNAGNTASQFGAQAQNQAALANQGAVNRASEFGAQASNQAMLSNAAARNQAAQFGAQAANQASLANAAAANQASQFGANAFNQAAMFNTGQANQASQFGAQAANQAAMQASAQQQEASRFGAQASNQARNLNQAAQNQALQFGAGASNAARLANASAANQASQFGANASNNAALANMSANNQAAQFGASSNNAAALANQASTNQGNQFTAAAANQAALANQNAGNQANQFGAQAANTAALANQAALNQAGQFGASAYNTAGLANQAALNQAGQFGAQATNTANLANQAALNQAGQFGAQATNTANLANQAALNQAGQFGANAMNNSSLANQNAFNQAAQFGAQAFNTGSLADQAAVNNARQFSANAMNNSSLANQSQANNMSQFNAQQRMAAQMANQTGQLAGSQQRLNAGNQLANLGNLGFGMGQTINRNMAQDGAMRQGLQQLLIDAARNQFNNYRNQPYSDVGLISAALGQSPVPQTTTTSKTPGLFDYLSLGASAMSDMRLKTNIKQVGDLPNGLGIYTWNWTDEAVQKGLANNMHIGVLAQEVEKIMPSAVVHTDSGYMAVKYNEILKEL
jgi:hypothetical protein